MKKTLKINYKNNLKEEYCVIKWLIGISIIAFMISIIFEFFPVSILKDTKLYFIGVHFNYFTNILLGISASSVISLIGLMFPFKTKRDKQINCIIDKLRNIYIQYIEINYYFYRESTGELKNDTYNSDKIILNNVLNLKNDINDVILEYSTVDFTSEYIEKILDTLDSKLLLCIDVIERFYLITIKSSNDEDDDKEKDIIEKNAEQDYFKVLYKTLDSIVQLNEFKSIFSRIIISDLAESTEHIIRELDEISSLYKNSDRIKLQLYYTNMIFGEISNISNIYSKEYTIAYDKIHDRIIKIVENNNAEKLFDKDNIELIHKLINNGDFDKANKDLDAMEEKLNSIM